MPLGSNGNGDQRKQFWQINIGHVLTIVVLLSTLFAGYVNLRRDVQESRKDIEGLLAADGAINERMAAADQAIATRINTAQNLINERLSQQAVQAERMTVQIIGVHETLSQIRDEIRRQRSDDGNGPRP